MYVKNFKELYVWQRAMELVAEIYKISFLLPSEERFGLVSQMRRSAISIPSNIAEGHRRSRKEFIRFLNIADGSTAELETQLILAQQLYSFMQSNHCLELIVEIQKMLSTMILKLRNTIN